MNTLPEPVPTTPILLPAYTRSTVQTHLNLLTMPFPAFAQCVADLLINMGYADVALMKPMYSRGRNHHGGFDIQAWINTGFTRSLVIAQVKQYRGPVTRNYVDELRGTMLRLGATQGLLVTTASFARAAKEAAESGQHVLPVRLIDGLQLSGLLARQGVPVPSPAGSKQIGANVDRTPPRREIVGRPDASQARRHAHRVILPLPLGEPQELAIVVTLDAHPAPGTGDTPTPRAQP